MKIQALDKEFNLVLGWNNSLYDFSYSELDDLALVPNGQDGRAVKLHMEQNSRSGTACEPIRGHFKTMILASLETPSATSNGVSEARATGRFPRSRFGLRWF